MKTLGIIIARAGSQGLKNKHLLPLLGKSVISYTFEHAKAATRLDRVVVSSDSAEVLKLGRQWGFGEVERPVELATSDASVQGVLLHACREVEKSGFMPEAIALLYGNCPVRPAGLIDQAIEELEKSGCDSVRSFAPVGKMHPNWMARVESGRVKAYLPGSIHRRQDLEPLYFHDGGIVVVTRKALDLQVEHPEDPHAFFGAERRAVMTEAGSVVEIDRSVDLYLAEAVLRAGKSENQGV